MIAGDDAEAKAVVTNLLDDFGFDTVDAGPLREGWRIRRDTLGYSPRRTAEELRKDLASAKRYAEQRSLVGQTKVRSCTSLVGVTPGQRGTGPTQRNRRK